MNWKSGLIAGVALLIVSMSFSMLAGAIYPPFAIEMKDTAVFRPFSDPLMMLFFAYPFVMSFALMHLWNLVQSKLKGSTLWEKSTSFANSYFIVGTIPGMFITLTSMQVSFAAILIWSVTGYLEAYTAAMVFQKVK